MINHSSDEQWWAPRRDNEPTAEYLARVLDDLGATQLAANARAYHYDDYRCPDHIDDAMNIYRLILDIEAWAVTHNHPRRARIVAAAARFGEFDGTADEATAWAASPEGQATFAQLYANARQARP